MTTLDRSPLHALLKRDRWVVLTGLGLVMIASWGYVLWGGGMGMPAWEMSSLEMALGQPPSMAEAMGVMAAPAGWSIGYAVLMFFMWWVMMIAMMTPSAAPTILLYARVNRRHRDHQGSYGPTGLFAGGYLGIWALFSVLAVLSQWAFETVGVLSPATLNSTNQAFAGGILVAAGLYQMTPFKQNCLKHCRSPIDFLSSHWRDGRKGALVMGARHGLFCLGCCWGLMALLFFGGVMNLYWIGGLAVLVLLEKFLPAGHWLAVALGVGLVIWGGLFLGAASV